MHESQKNQHLCQPPCAFYRLSCVFQLALSPFEKQSNKALLHKIIYSSPKSEETWHVPYTVGSSNLDEDCCHKKKKTQQTNSSLPSHAKDTQLILANLDNTDGNIQVATGRCFSKLYCPFSKLSDLFCQISLHTLFWYHTMFTLTTLRAGAR